MSIQVERANAIRIAAFSAATRQWSADRLVSDFRVVLFCATDRSSWGPHIEFDPDYGWGSHIKGPLVIEHVPGNHITMVEQPNVFALVRKLQRFL